MTPAADAALPRAVTDTGRSVARAVAALLPSRPPRSGGWSGQRRRSRPGSRSRRIPPWRFHCIPSRTPPLRSAYPEHRGSSYRQRPRPRGVVPGDQPAPVAAADTVFSRGPLGGWINRVTHHFCRNWKSAQAARETVQERHATEVIALGEADAVLEDPSKLMERTEFMDDLRLALAELPPRQERTFTLIHVMGTACRRRRGSWRPDRPQCAPTFATRRKNFAT